MIGMTTTRKRKTSKIPPIPPEPPRFNIGLNITADIWRKTPALVSEARRIQGEVTFSHMIETLRAESPANQHLYDADLAGRAIHQAAIEGYNQAIATLLSLAEPHKDMPVLEETFEAEHDDPGYQ